MKYLLFDQNAIAAYVSDFRLQSIEYAEGFRLLQHFRGNIKSEFFFNTKIEYNSDGVLFVGQRNTEPGKEEVNKHIFCMDLTTCRLFDEESNDARALTVMQKTFRLVLKIWNRDPMSASEKYNGTKSILFPFSIGDRHRLVIERSNTIERLEARDIKFPLLAYKYNAEDPSHMVEIADTAILRSAGEEYAAQRYRIQDQLNQPIAQENSTPSAGALTIMESDLTEKRDDFIYWDYDNQLKLLTESQKGIVEFEDESVPIRIDGAAGTGKTAALIMRAYRLLQKHRDEQTSFRIIFFAHSESTSQRNREVFSTYSDSDCFLKSDSLQSIEFTTLFSYCRKIGHITETSVIEPNASDAKEYQFAIIEDVVKKAYDSKTIRTYRPLISNDVRSLFDREVTDLSTLVNMLQHEFSVQIKGRTDFTIESYREIESIENGIPCRNKSDKELVFALFMNYQKELQTYGTFDVDDVTMEAISRLNAPKWRRMRQTEGFDYIIVDEMHLFNLNEQSVFHFLSKDVTKTDIPMCFALDYNQAIGDLGNTEQDYIASGKLGSVSRHNLGTLFRNSPQIAEFCASLAASGTLMFGTSFHNPYSDTQSQFTPLEEKKMEMPELHMYPNDDSMLADLKRQVSSMMRSLQCSRGDIAVVCFDNRWISVEGIAMIEQYCKESFQRLLPGAPLKKDQYVLASPYDINGLEFKAVIMLAADEGRVPQTFGTGDISRNFIMYSAYNMMYLTASRAKYRLILMGSDLNGVSSCLEHSLAAGTILTKQHSVINS